MKHQEPLTTRTRQEDLACISLLLGWLPPTCHLKNSSVNKISGLNLGVTDEYLEILTEKKGICLVGLDDNKERIDKTIYDYPKFRGRLICGSVATIPFPSNEFDLVIAHQFLQLLTPQLLSTGLKEIYRVLKPRGIILGSIPFDEDLSSSIVYCPTCRKSFHASQHLQSFDDSQLEIILISHGFVVEKIIRKTYCRISFRNIKSWLIGLIKMTASKMGISQKEDRLLFLARKPLPESHGQNYTIESQ